MSPDPGVVLEATDLQIEFTTRAGVVRAVDGVSFSVRRGRTLAIVGESGSGKSTTALGITGLLPRPAGRIAGGSVRFEGRELVAEEQFRAVRGDGVAMIFQDPMSSLNPVMTVGKQIGEALRRRRGFSAKAARARAIELMEQVRIPAATQRVDAYPHQFSGGMRQRVMIALALALEPKVLIADEPTTALDVTVQAEIMALLADLRDERDMGIVLITHDLGVVAESAHEVLVMYGGKPVEEGPVTDVFPNPAHPYTAGLLASIPRIDELQDRLPAIPGQPPDLRRLPEGCAFSARCPMVQDVCHTSRPAFLPVAPHRSAACHFAREGVPA
ncbi:ABC transporter ATP-binding protein [Agromyces aerolatus]|uniref:ABC transporter ATP-binding protein n=1 Tax=Agromyces sp. LY-1074 TaxID=3074080 RepID=UPI002864240E|nr:MULTISPECIES: ABC transporter ATP-binding protein [unclassified Agromyces]MDR5701201.1 ABC transporter ATP-binding protein [Agromyces sp. LY-1074]MDR5706923.1 ABC transporter ATP-binding protein [Agromyces sp. LY-1358]